MGSFGSGTSVHPTVGMFLYSGHLVEIDTIYKYHILKHKLPELVSELSLDVGCINKSLVLFKFPCHVYVLNGINCKRVNSIQIKEN